MDIKKSSIDFIIDCLLGSLRGKGQPTNLNFSLNIKSKKKLGGGELFWRSRIWDKKLN